MFFAVLGVIATALSLIYRSEELGAIAIPLLVIPITIIVGSWSRWNVELVYKYFMYGVLLTLALEIVSYALYITVAGKATSLSIFFGVIFLLLYEYIVARRRSKETKKTEKPVVAESSSETIIESASRSEKEG